MLCSCSFYLHEEHDASIDCRLSTERPDFQNAKGLWRSSSFGGGRSRRGSEQLTRPRPALSGQFMKSKFAGSVALLVTGILSPALWNATAAEAANSYVPFDGEKTTWHDAFERYDYLMDETTFAIAPFKRPESEKFAVGNPPKGQRRCIIVVPKKIAPRNPWSWQAC